MQKTTEITMSLQDSDKFVKGATVRIKGEFRLDGKPSPPLVVLRVYRHMLLVRHVYGRGSAYTYPKEAFYVV